MATEVWIALIAMIGVAITTGINAYVSLKTKDEVKDMHTSVNSKMDKLLKAATELARIEGRDEERAAVKEKAAENKQAFQKGGDAARAEKPVHSKVVEDVAAVVDNIEEIKEKTDQLTFTQPKKVDSSVKK